MSTLQGRFDFIVGFGAPQASTLEQNPFTGVAGGLVCTASKCRAGLTRLRADEESMRLIAIGRLMTGDRERALQLWRENHSGEQGA